MFSVWVSAIVDSFWQLVHNKTPLFDLQLDLGLCCGRVLECSTHSVKQLDRVKKDAQRVHRVDCPEYWGHLNDRPMWG